MNHLQQLFPLQAMHALFGMRDTVQIHEGSPLQTWLKRHGARTVGKYSELLNAGGVGPVSFHAETPSKTFDAHIDPENKFTPVDKFSQVVAVIFILYIVHLHYFRTTHQRLLLLL